MVLDPSSKARLTHKLVDRFPGDTLFDRVARALCGAGCLPRKELYESWETAKRVRRRFAGGRVVDLCCGHGLLAHLMLLLDDDSPEAIAVDTRVPPCAAKVREVLVAAWPRLAGRVRIVQASMETIELLPGDVVVSAHACGGLTDAVIAQAVAARARVAVLPCCHDLAKNDDGGLAGWMDGPLAIDAARAVQLRARGYDVFTSTIPATITEKNRLLLGAPITDM